MSPPITCVYQCYKVQTHLVTKSRKKMMTKSAQGARVAANQRQNKSQTIKKAKSGKSSGKHPGKIEKGGDVVKTVCTQLANARIFPTLDSSLLEMVAKHESNFGNDKTDGKGRPPMGGIWRISRPGFDDTVNLYAHPHLEQYYIRIFKAFRIDWSKVDWKTDMDIPLYSGLAAGLLIVICTAGLFPYGPNGKMIISNKDVLKGLYYSSSMKNYESMSAEQKRKRKPNITPGMVYS